MRQSDSKNISFILVRPEFLGNIGSVARVMKNFGLSDLRFIDAPRNYKDADARKMAVGAFDVLKGSSMFATLSEAIKDLHFVIATSSGQQRNQPLQSLDEALKSAPLSVVEGKIGVVFGDERNGLRTEELSLCHVIAKIPTSSEFPALNLAQAACIVGYELSKYCEFPKDAPVEVVLPAVGEIDQLFEQVQILLDNIEFARTYNGKQIIAEIRHFLHRAKVTKRESDLLRGVLHKLNQALRKD